MQKLQVVLKKLVNVIKILKNGTQLLMHIKEHQNVIKNQVMLGVQPEIQKLLLKFKQIILKLQKKLMIQSVPLGMLVYTLKLLKVIIILKNYMQNQQHIQLKLGKLKLPLKFPNKDMKIQQNQIKNIMFQKFYLFIQKFQCKIKCMHKLLIFTNNKFKFQKIQTLKLPQNNMVYQLFVYVQQWTSQLEQKMNQTFQCKKSLILQLHLNIQQAIECYNYMKMVNNKNSKNQFLDPLQIYNFQLLYQDQLKNQNVNKCLFSSNNSLKHSQKNKKKNKQSRIQNKPNRLQKIWFYENYKLQFINHYQIYIQIYIYIININYFDFCKKLLNSYKFCLIKFNNQIFFYHIKKQNCFNNYLHINKIKLKQDVLQKVFKIYISYKIRIQIYIIFSVKYQFF